MRCSSQAFASAVANGIILDLGCGGGRTYFTKFGTVIVLIFPIASNLTVKVYFIIGCDSFQIYTQKQLLRCMGITDWSYPNRYSGGSAKQALRL